MCEDLRGKFVRIKKIIIKKRESADLDGRGKDLGLVSYPIENSFLIWKRGEDIFSDRLMFAHPLSAPRMTYPSACVGLA